MSTIGTFTATKDGGWAGTIRTLMIDMKVRLVPNDNRDSDRAPEFRVLAGHCDLGAAWRHRTSSTNPREYLRVQIDDPSLSHPISAAMFVDPARNQAQLVWSRRRLE